MNEPDYKYRTQENNVVLIKWGYIYTKYIWGYILFTFLGAVTVA